MMNVKRDILRILVLLAITTSALVSCQEPIEEIIDPPAESVIAPNSNIATLLQQVSLNDGSSDNIVDSASCLSLAFPFTVNANGLEVIIDSEEDLELIEDIFDEFEEDDDLLEILFPVTVILADHSEFVIENEDAFEELVDECADVEDDDIECIDLEYPITVSTYDTVDQTSSVIVLEDDEDLYDLIEDLDDDNLIGFNFPITVILSDSSTVIIDNNDELEEIIEEVKDDCDEDDDDGDDYDGDDDDGMDDDHYSDTTVVTMTIIEGEWIVARFEDDGNNMTSEFEGFTLEFFEDGDVVAGNGTDTIEGSWEELVDDNVDVEFILDFGSDTFFELLNDDWDLVEIREDRIEFVEDDAVDDGTAKVLVLEKL